MDYLSIDNLEVYAYHGVYEAEKEEGQRFLISARLYLDLSRASREDELSETVSYADAAVFMEKRVRETCRDLIEAVADDLADGLLLHFSMLKRVSVTVSKPEAPIPVKFGCVSVTVEKTREIAYLSIGSNMGDRQEYLNMAVSRLSEDPKIEVTKVSAFLETEPVGPVEQPDFLNAAVELTTIYSPEELLDALHGIENEADRRRTVHWGPRTLDLDILLFGDRIISRPDLTIPHPEMTNRSFVLLPMCEIAPLVMHPVYKRNMSQLLGSLEKRAREPKLYDISAFAAEDELKTEGVLVAYAGVPGAYAQEAAERRFGYSAKLINLPTFDEVAEAVRDGRADYGVLPIENSSAGFVSGNLDLILETGVTIVNEVILDIDHALLGVPGAAVQDIRKVFSHQQGLMQCRDFIRQHGLTGEQVSNTALAAEMVKESGDRTCGAIASIRAAEIYGLTVLERHINFSHDNATRFFVISGKKEYLADADKVWISFHASHRVGSLYEIMGIINRYGLNMTSIESRPSKRKKWEYSFYVSFEGRLTDRRVRKALGAIRDEADSLFVLGTI